MKYVKGAAYGTAKSVIIDAGHGGAEPGAMFEGRKEKDDTLRLALAVGEILENNGIRVMYTRTTDVYDTPLEKAMIANGSGADFSYPFTGMPCLFREPEREH